MTRNEFVDAYFRENYKRLLKFARKRVGNYNLQLAEDALQDAFYKACKYFRSFSKTDGDFDEWFGRILVNSINDQKRAEINQGRVKEGAPDHDYIVTVPFTKEVIDALDKQPLRNQEILNMYFFYGYKSREVAEFMSISHDVVRDVIRMFRKRVRSV